MSRNYLNSDEFRRDDIAFVEAMDRVAKRRATAELAGYEGMRDHLKALAARCDAKTGDETSVLCTLHAGWQWSIAVMAWQKGGAVRLADESFLAATFAEALAAVNAWLNTDEGALLNLTLGLTADGGLA